MTLQQCPTSFTDQTQRSCLRDEKLHRMALPRSRDEPVQALEPNETTHRMAQWPDYESLHQC